jgi:hypothetical protein
MQSVRARACNIAVQGSPEVQQVVLRKRGEKVAEG